MNEQDELADDERDWRPEMSAPLGMPPWETLGDVLKRRGFDLGADDHDEVAGWLTAHVARAVWNERAASAARVPTNQEKP